jgi:hypothetical protein
MFIPNSPRPPRGMALSLPVGEEIALTPERSPSYSDESRVTSHASGKESSGSLRNCSSGALLAGSVRLAERRYIQHSGLAVGTTSDAELADLLALH